MLFRNRIESAVTSAPMIGGPATYLLREFKKRSKVPGTSADFWDSLYRKGGSSGTGSYGRLALYKAEVLNRFITEHAVISAVELGCGDGNQLGLVSYPRYIGLDVAPAAIERCRQQYGDDPTKEFMVYPPAGAGPIPSADLSVSLDVIYHLLEDDVFETYMARLFDAGERFVVVYSSDKSTPERWPEVRHWPFTQWVARNRPDWKLIQTEPNPYPWNPREQEETSWADFFFFARAA